MLYEAADLSRHMHELSVIIPCCILGGCDQVGWNRAAADLALQY